MILKQEKKIQLATKRMVSADTSTHASSVYRNNK